jgi:hypothetical protein
MPKTIDYGVLTGAQKREKALGDLAGWLNCDDNLEQFKREIGEMLPTPENAHTVRMQLAFFAGVSGYPVVALLGESWQLSDESVWALFEEMDRRIEHAERN